MGMRSWGTPIDRWWAFVCCLLGNGLFVAALFFLDNPLGNAAFWIILLFAVILPGVAIWALPSKNR